MPKANKNRLNIFDIIRVPTIALLFDLRQAIRHSDCCLCFDPIAVKNKEVSQYEAIDDLVRRAEEGKL
jgi:hypothetical protein